MGSVKKEVVLLGDTLTTARIQEFCRHAGDRLLASADLIDRLELPPDLAKPSPPARKAERSGAFMR
jgi:hypothetical protein